MSFAYLRLLLFLPAPWHTPFPIWSQSVVPCPVLTVASWSAYKFLKRQVRWSGIPISLRMLHSYNMGFHVSSVGKESAFNAGDPGSIPGLGGSPGEGIGYPLQYSWASLVAQLVKNLLTMQETWVWALGWEDSPGEGISYSLQYSGLENSVDYIVHGSGRVRHNWVTFTFSAVIIIQLVRNFKIK